MLVSLACIIAAGAALWSWISPETIGGTRTAHLIGLLALFVLPVATLMTMEVDRRHRAVRARIAKESASGVESIARGSRSGQESRAHRHAPRDEAVIPSRRRTRARPGHARADHGC